ncbi:Bacterial sugar transferase (plasmid) [Vibrio sp. B1REV9]|nr:sugar transferase [Vibrio sp. B1REV9]CAE6957282.1 Bacterial sugar transferase [Vibrio sp. B1REV9]
MSSAKFHGLNTNNTVMIVTDFIMIFASFILTLLCAKLFVSNFYLSYSDIEIYLQFFVFSIPLHLILLGVGLYNEKLRERFNGIILRIFVAIILGYILTNILSQMFTKTFFPPSFNELLFFITFLTLCNCRFMIIKLGLNQLSKRRVLVLGSGKRASIIEQCMRRKSDRVGLEFVGFVSVKGDADNQIKADQVLTVSEPLETYVLKQNINELVIAIDERRDNLPIEALLQLKQVGVQITDIIEFVERETGQVAVNYLTPSWFLFQNHRSKNQWRTNAYWLFNSFVALSIALITLPVMLITVFAMKIESGRHFPVLYSQERVGLMVSAFLSTNLPACEQTPKKMAFNGRKKTTPGRRKLASLFVNTASTNCLNFTMLSMVICILLAPDQKDPNLQKGSVAPFPTITKDIMLSPD